MTNQRGETGDPCGVPTETRAKPFGEPWSVEPASPTGKEGPGPGNQVWVNSLFLEHAAKSGGVHVVEPTLNVQEKRGNVIPGHLKGSYFLGQGGSRIRGRQASQRTALVRVQEAC